MPRRIQSMGNLCLGGKTRRKNYREEKIWGKDGAKPHICICLSPRVHKVNDASLSAGIENDL